MKNITVSNDHLPDGVDEFRQPVLVEDEELDELKAKAGDSEKDFEELQSKLEDLSDAQEKVEELKEEKADLESKAEAVDDVKEVYADELAASGLLDKEDYMAMEVSSLRSKVDDLHEEEDNPNPKGDSGSQGEVEEESEEEEVAEEIESLKEDIEWYEDQGWESNADAAREELNELTE